MVTTEIYVEHSSPRSKRGDEPWYMQDLDPEGAGSDIH